MARSYAPDKSWNLQQSDYYTGLVCNHKEKKRNSPVQKSGTTADSLQVSSRGVPNVLVFLLLRLFNGFGSTKSGGITLHKSQ